MLAFLTLVGVVGNASPIIAVGTDVRLQTTANFFVVYMAFADLLFCGIVNLMAIISVTQEGWPLSETMCKVTSMLSLLNLGVSVGLLAAIALNRVVCIVKFSKYESVQRVSIKVHQSNEKY